MEQLNSRKIQAQKTKERIISATSELLKEKTLDEINVTDICKSADVSVGAFYHHFQNKEFIIIELYTTVDLYFETHVYPYFSKKQPEVEDLVEYLAIQCDYAIRMGIALVQNAYKAQINYGNEFFLSKDRGLAKFLVQIINRIYEYQLLEPDTNLEQLVDDLLMISRGIIYNWCVSNGEADIIFNTKRIVRTYLQPFLKK